MKKDPKVIISLIILLVLLLSVSYAFFAISPNVTEQELSVDAATISLEYTDCGSSSQADCANISAELKPGDTVTKTFRIENTGDVATEYAIVFKELSNTFLHDELVYTLEDVTNSETLIEDKPVPYASQATTNKIVANNISIGYNETNEYRLTIKFKETTGNQNYNANATFSIKMGASLKMTLANYIKSNVPVVTSGAGLYHHTSDTTAADYVANSAEDDSYRYAGAGGHPSAESSYNPSLDLVENWVCFGETDGSNCSDTHQWRIIGIMPDGTIKIIKAESIGNMAFGYDNVWATSTLKNYLNGNDFLNNSTYFDASMREMLVSSPIWNVGSAGDPRYITAKGFYDYEKNTTTSSGGTIGLPNVSDYGFAATSDRWSTAVGFYSATGQNGAPQYDWIFKGINQWYISQSNNGSNYIVYANYYGQVNNYGSVGMSYGVLPAAFLKSNVIYTGGSGTYTDMYTIE